MDLGSLHVSRVRSCAWQKGLSELVSNLSTRGESIISLSASSRLENRTAGEKGNGRRDCQTDG